MVLDGTMSSVCQQSPERGILCKGKLWDRLQETDTWKKTTSIKAEPRLVFSQLHIQGVHPTLQLFIGTVVAPEEVFSPSPSPAICQL